MQSGDTDQLAGICLACSYHCHDGHELVELYTKRYFKFTLTLSLLFYGGYVLLKGIFAVTVEIPSFLQTNAHSFQ